jgi:hypothetical protein
MSRHDAALFKGVPLVFSRLGRGCASISTGSIFGRGCITLSMGGAARLSDAEDQVRVWTGTATLPLLSPPGECLIQFYLVAIANHVSNHPGEVSVAVCVFEADDLDVRDVELSDDPDRAIEWYLMVSTLWDFAELVIAVRIKAGEFGAG